MKPPRGESISSQSEISPKLESLSGFLIISIGISIMNSYWIISSQECLIAEVTQDIT